MNENSKINVYRSLSLILPSDISRGAVVMTMTTEQRSWAAMHDVVDVIRLIAQVALTKIQQTRQREPAHAD